MNETGNPNRSPAPGSDTTGRNEAGGNRRLAEAIVAALQPGSVLIAGSEADELAEELLGLGVLSRVLEESGQRRSRRPAEPDGRFDLTIALEAGESSAGFGDRLRRLAARGATLLLVPVAPAGLGPRRISDWLFEASGHGFVPDLRFKAEPIAPRAVLFRTCAPLREDVLELFAECVEFRAASRSVPKPDDTAAEPGRLREQVSILEEQLARERTYLETLRSVHAYMTQEISRLRDPSRLPAASVQAVDAQKIAAQVRAELTSLPSPEADQSVVWQVLRQNADMRAHLTRLEQRIAIAESGVQAASLQIRDIADSRIWRGLVSAAGLLLRLTGRGAPGR